MGSVAKNLELPVVAFVFVCLLSVGVLLVYPEFAVRVSGVPIADQFVNVANQIARAFNGLAFEQKLGLGTGIAVLLSGYTVLRGTRDR